MAVIITNGATSLSTGSGFYRVEAHNLSCFSATLLSLSSTRTISLTYANAGNALGVMIYLRPDSSASLKDVTVTLKESGTTRASKTLTAAQISNSVANPTSDGWIVPFIFTAPYAVTTTPGVWTIDITNATGTNNWSVRTSNATAVSYAAWCDNAVSFANNDTVIAKDVLTIDQTATVKGVTSTGDTTNAPAIVICKGSDGTPANVSNVVWDGSASRTLTVDGIILFGAHSGFRAGTSASRISVANQGIVDFIAPTVGTVNGFQDTQRANSVFGRKSSLFIYGEFRSLERTELAANAVLGGTVTISNASPAVVTKATHGYSSGMPIVFSTTGALPTGLTAGTTYYVLSTGANTFNVEASIGGGAINTSSAGSGVHTVAPVIVTSVSTGWAVNDKVVVGKRTVKGTGDTTIRTISAISGAQITLSSGIASATAIQGATVARLNGYGFKVKMDTVSTSTLCYFKCPSNFQVSGCEFENFSMLMPVSSGESLDDTANLEPIKISHCSTAYTMSSTTTSFNVSPNQTGILIEYLNGFRTVHYSMSSITSSVGMTVIEVSHNRLIAMVAGTITVAGQAGIIIDDNTIENSGGNISITGAAITHTDNVYWGNSNGNHPQYNNLVSPVLLSGNKYQNNAVGLFISGLTVDAIEVDPVFTDSIGGTTNTTDFNVTTSAYIRFELSSPTGNLNIPTTNFPLMTTGSRVSISSLNDVVTDDKGYTPYGYWQRTGYGLFDTTAWTGTAFGAASAGQFAYRMQPISSTYPFIYADNNGSTTIGNCQNLTVSVTLRLTISSSGYYAGTHTLPTLRVTYDNGTVVSAVAAASTGGQQLQVTFTPTTDTENIKIEVVAATDASGANAYVYLGELMVLPPPGVFIDSTTLSKWANAIPLGTQRTFPAPGSVWDELGNNHNLPGTFGQSNRCIRSSTAQAGASTTLTLDTLASPYHDFYNNTILRITDGTGAGQSRFISDYDGDTKVATVNADWVTTPDNTSIFCIFPFGSVENAVWNALTADHTVVNSLAQDLFIAAEDAAIFRGVL